MNSKPLRQNIELAYDLRKASGLPFAKRDVAEEVLRISRPEHWSLEDQRRGVLAP